ncbi:bifunctional metallophosphatase/5'-nucleotidase [Levilactobacillus andaensis]|uniref:bifunctional metallophosphatase/5'-nucleotidase n=1 Tax=Levilactobacillus andaensis TaxID=2799570 RepID=UPI001944409C|nr:bifunctional metallophosphatase/5'-nucleotidase [Levilactobacillus andaensis]
MASLSGKTLYILGALGCLGAVAGGLMSPSSSLSPQTTAYAKKVAKKAKPTKKAKTIQIPVQFLGINDLHGGLQATGKLFMDSKTIEGAGTVARLGGYLDQAQTSFKKTHANGVTVRVQSGDMVGASPANSALLDDGPTLSTLKAMRVKVGVIGNHEFDHGLSQYGNLVNGKKPSTTGIKNPQQVQAIKKYPFVKTGMQIVIANVRDKQTNKIPANWKPYTIKKITDPKTKATVKVGYIGILNTNLPGIAKNYKLLNEAKTIAKYDKQLRAKGVKAIVVLGHTGAVTQNGKTTGDAVNDLKELNKIDPKNSVDIFFAGHSHQYANGRVKGVPVVQAGMQGRGYANITAKLSTKTHDFVKSSVKAKVAPVFSLKDDPTATFAKDKTVKKINGIIADANRRVAPIINTEVGSIAGGKTISNDLSNNKESAAAYVVVDAQRTTANEQSHQVDFAVTSNDSIRSDMNVNSAGKVTLGTLYDMQPYGNSQPIVEMTGKDIVDLLNEQYTKSQLYFLQISGLTYKYSPATTGDQLFTVSDVKTAKGDAINPTQKYHVLTNDYLSTGGDGYAAFTHGTIVDNAGQDIDLLTTYLQTHSPITTPKLDRKVPLA